MDKVRFSKIIRLKDKKLVELQFYGKLHV